MDLGERRGGCGCSFFSIEVPNMPLTLCHSSLMDTDIPQCELENRHLVHPSLKQQIAWYLESLLVSMVNIMAFHDSAHRGDLIQLS